MDKTFEKARLQNAMWDKEASAGNERLIDSKL